MSQETPTPESEIDESLFHLTDESIKDIVEAVEQQDADTVTTALEELSPADTAELISKVDNENRDELLSMYAETLSPECFLEMVADLKVDNRAWIPVHTRHCVHPLSKHPLPVLAKHNLPFPVRFPHASTQHRLSGALPFRSR